MISFSMFTKAKQALKRPETLFFLASGFAGVINYVFQIYVARSLTPSAFADWSVWWAQFSLACGVGIWLQHLATLTSIKSWALINNPWILWPALVMMSGLTFIPDVSPNLAMSGWWLVNVMNGLMYGAVLRQARWIPLSLALVATAAVRFFLAQIPTSLDPFRWAPGLSPLFGMLILSFVFFERTEHSTKKSDFKWPEAPVLFGALGLSVLTALIPQFDVLTSQALLPKLEFEAYCKLALANRGLFFFFMILSQILLAKQVNSSQTKLSFKTTAFFIAGLSTTLIAIGLSLPHPFASRWLLPLSFLNTLSLVGLYLSAQSFAVKKQTVAVFAILILVAGLCLSTQLRQISFLNFIFVSLLTLNVGHFWIYKRASKAARSF